MSPPFDPAQLPPGTRIADKYVLASPIGWGEHSVVYEATHRLLQRKAAVKVFGEPLDQPGASRFAREARLAGALRHRNVVELYEVGSLPNGRPFLVLEHLEGETVEARIARAGPLPIADALGIAQEVLHGLGAAHEQNIVHRDLRPANIFLAKVRGEEVAKILDFGTARQLGSTQDTITAPGTHIGHAAYFAPEQLALGVQIDHRVDLYATGVLLYVMLTGRLPFTSKSGRLLIEVAKSIPPGPSTWRPEVPRDVDRAVLAALEKEPSARYQSAEQMAEALRLAALFAEYVSGESKPA